jgi:hypothetical protein
MNLNAEFKTLMKVYLVQEGKIDSELKLAHFDRFVNKSKVK